jgi:hypothetical protein
MVASVATHPACRASVEVRMSGAIGWNPRALVSLPSGNVDGVRSAHTLLSSSPGLVKDVILRA